tara:strand:+ start:270 stop:437 length:168 start_codon:yes stop_codon:yes gene_type:complete
MGNHVEFKEVGYYIESVAKSKWADLKKACPDEYDDIDVVDKSISVMREHGNVIRK